MYPRTREKIERNNQIFINVCKGYSYAQVGKVFGVSGIRCRQICDRIISIMKNRKLIDGLKIESIKDLRMNKHRLISIVTNGIESRSTFSQPVNLEVNRDK
jgi:hypothetical protein